MKRSQFKRGGYTLVQMVASMILVSMLSGMLVVLTRRAIQGYSHTIDRMFVEHTGQRWAEQLRLDIHQAEDAILGPNRDSLTLKLSDQESIEYAKGVNRTTRQRTIRGRVLSAEETPWSDVFFERMEMPNGILIEATVTATVAAEPKVRARLGCEKQ
jgi:type II secretory pathway component PulJ